jgi:hypothetical protein
MPLIKANAKMQLVTSCGAVLGTLFKDVDERITWRKNALLERELLDSEVAIIKGIVKEWNNGKEEEK